MEIPVPEFNEGMRVLFCKGRAVSNPEHKCKHLKPFGNSRHWILPRGIQAFNEAGYNSTVICLDCLLEWNMKHEAD